jgi:23S rRNA pseudouridine2605 synthase
MEERLQKILARAGYGSRRASETLIAAGRVRVNGQVVDLGAKADPQRDRIEVDGTLLKAPEALVYIALNKPRGVLSTVAAPDPRPTVRDLIDIPTQIFPVGRLDIESEGLILLTNDGDLANRLTHPRYGHEKEYKVLVARRPDEEQLQTWRRGVVLEDGYQTAPAEVRLEQFHGKGAWLRIVMHEGRKRQIREVGSLLGLPVVRIERVRIGTLLLGGLQPRQWRYLTAEEVADLQGRKRAPSGKPTIARASGRPLGPPRRPRRDASGAPGGGQAGGGRPGGGKPAPSRPAGGKPGGGRPATGRPGGGKPAPSRPASGSKPFKRRKPE